MDEPIGIKEENAPATALIPQETRALQPIPETEPAKMSPNQAAMSGLKRIVGRIKDFPQRYTDDSGAQFIRELYDSQPRDGITGPEKALDFFRRLELDGFRVKMTGEESEIMENVRPKTSPHGLLAQARIVDGAAATLTRRNFIRKAGYVATGLAVDQLGQGMKSKSKQIGDKVKDLKSIEDELGKDGLPLDKRDELAARRAQVQKSLEEGPIGKVASTLSQHPALLTTLGIIGYQLYAQGADVIAHANQKADKVIDFTSRVVDHKMGYTAVAPETEMTRG